MPASALPARFIFLGTGTSGGVPLIACDCATCASDDPRDRRTRTSAAVQWVDPSGAPRCVLIDAGPDLHAQARRAGLWRCDAILFTHNHVDHIFGLDEVRRFNAVMRQPIDIYAEGYVLESLRRVYRHIFDQGANVNDSFVATLIAHEVAPPSESAREPSRGIDLWGMRFTPIRLYHGRLPVLGWRIEPSEGGGAEGILPLAYCTDVSSIPPQTWPLLEGLETLILDALRVRKHPTHFTIDQAVDAALQVGASRTRFIHMSHELKHAEVDAHLPEGMALAHDGMVLGLLGEAGERVFADDACRLSESIRRLDPGRRAGHGARASDADTRRPADRFDEG